MMSKNLIQQEYNFLIGESLLKSKDKEKKIGELLLN